MMEEMPECPATWRWIARFACSLALALCLSQAAVTEPASCEDALSPRDEIAVRAVLETYRTSWLRGDAEGVLGTFTSDAVLLPAHGAGPVVGMEAIRRYWWPAGAPPTTITRLEITVEQIGGDCRLAYAHGRDDVEWAVTKGGTTETHGHPGTYLNVFRKRPDGTWRIARHMWDDGPGR